MSVRKIIDELQQTFFVSSLSVGKIIDELQQTFDELKIKVATENDVGKLKKRSEFVELKVRDSIRHSEEMLKGDGIY